MLYDEKMQQKNKPRKKCNCKMKFSSLILFGTLLSASTVKENKVNQQKNKIENQSILTEEQEVYTFS